MTNQTEQGAARPRITVELLHRVYRNTPEWAPYLRARFAEPGAKSFELDGHRWAYRCSSFDDAGDYDLLWRPDANPTSEGYTSGQPNYTLLNALCKLGAEAAHASAQANSDDGHSGAGAQVRFYELRMQMWELITSARSQP